MIKIIAMYLPQFHETNENNEWWGKGFTEWTAAKSAQPQFENHYQPHIPLNSNYYNLLQKETMEWQAKIMNAYNVYGMCFYHYWFKDGRKILEKPAENLIKWKDIDMPFCFSWANESWTRTWSHVENKNVWVTLNESIKEKEKNPSGILLEQQYGGEAEWRAHFEYLNDFFSDERYIKIDNKPVFMIYKPDMMECFSDMKQLWNHLAVEHGYNGIYFIACNSKKSDDYDKLLLHEPQYTLRENTCKPYALNSVRSYYEYEGVWENIIQRENNNQKVIHGGFVGYDDTPRRGNGGIVVNHTTPETFKKYLKALLKKNALLDNEYVFINAWNEWGEGMHLEPDQKYGYAFLEAVKQALCEYEHVDLSEYKGKMELHNNDKLLRYESYWKILHQWMLLKEKDIKLSSYLLSKGIDNIAVYGVGMLGKHLIEELRNTAVYIKYGIDANAENIICDIPIKKVGITGYSHTDLIVVTVVYDYDVIEKRLREHTDSQIISLMDLLKAAEKYDER